MSVLLFVFDTMQTGYANSMFLQGSTLKGEAETVAKWRLLHCDGEIKALRGDVSTLKGEVCTCS